MTASERLLLLSSKKQQFEKLNRSAISAMFYLFTFFFFITSLMPQEGISSFGLMALKKRFLKGVFSPCCLKLSFDFFPQCFSV